MASPTWLSLVLVSAILVAVAISSVFQGVRDKNIEVISDCADFLLLTFPAGPPPEKLGGRARVDQSLLPRVLGVSFFVVKRSFQVWGVWQDQAKFACTVASFAWLLGSECWALGLLRDGSVFQLFKFGAMVLNTFAVSALMLDFWRCSCPASVLVGGAHFAMGAIFQNLAMLASLADSTRAHKFAAFAIVAVLIPVWFLFAEKTYLWEVLCSVVVGILPCVLVLMVVGVGVGIAFVKELLYPGERSLTEEEVPFCAKAAKRESP